MSFKSDLRAASDSVVGVASYMRIVADKISEAELGEVDVAKTAFDDELIALLRVYPAHLDDLIQSVRRIDKALLELRKMLREYQEQKNNPKNPDVI